MRPVRAHGRGQRRERPYAGAVYLSPRRWSIGHDAPRSDRTARRRLRGDAAALRQKHAVVIRKKRHRISAGGGGGALKKFVRRRRGHAGVMGDHSSWAQGEADLICRAVSAPPSSSHDGPEWIVGLHRLQAIPVSKASRRREAEMSPRTRLQVPRVRAGPRRCVVARFDDGAGCGGGAETQGTPTSFVLDLDAGRDSWWADIAVRTIFLP